MTDKQLVQKLLADYFDCLVCTDHGKKLCELHAADERTEVYAQSPRMQEVYGCE